MKCDKFTQVLSPLLNLHAIQNEDGKYIQLANFVKVCKPSIQAIRPTKILSFALVGWLMSVATLGTR